VEWRFSDGTVVRLGGVVEGVSAFAQRLRDDLERLAEDFRPPEVAVGPMPAPLEKLDPQNAYHVNAWVMESADRHIITPVSVPTLPPLPAESSEPGVVY
jgi:hypothetical protein